MEERLTGVPGSRCEQDGLFFPDPIEEQYGYAECVAAGHTIAPGPEFPYIPPTVVQVNKLDLTDKVALQVPDLLVMITDLQARLDIPKDALTNTELRRTIRDVRQLARDVIQLARLVGNVLDSTDSGTP